MYNLALILGFSYSMKIFNVAGISLVNQSFTFHRSPAISVHMISSQTTHKAQGEAVVATPICELQVQKHLHSY